jgi:hypothetical protein
MNYKIIVVLILFFCILVYILFRQKHRKHSLDNYHHTHADRIIVKLKGGIGNRLRCLSSAMVLADLLHKPLIVWWRIDQYMPVGMVMDDVILGFHTIDYEVQDTSLVKSTDPDLDNIKSECHTTIVTDVVYNHAKGEDIVGFSTNPGTGYFRLFKDERMPLDLFYTKRLQALQSLVFNPKVVEYNNMITRQWLRKPIGVHIRRGDLCSLVNGSEGCTDLNNYYESMKKYSAIYGTHFFIASDDISAIAEAKKWAITEGWTLYFNTIVADRLSIEGQQISMAEILALSSCSFIIGTLASTFTSESAAMGGISYVQVG